VTSILVVTNMYPPHHFGGYELMCLDVVEHWRQRGHDVTVLTTDLRRPGVSEEPSPPSRVRRDLRFYWDDHELVSPSLPKRVAIERHNQRQLAAALAASRPDVVSIWNMGAMSFGLLTTLIERGLPLVYVVCGDWLMHGVAMDPWARLFVGRRRFARLAHAATGLPTTVADLGASGAFCFISDALRRETSANTPWRYERSAVTYSGINATLFNDSGARDTMEWRGRLLYAGRLDSRKGIDTAVRALADLPDARLEVNGRGDTQELRRLRELAASLAVDARVHVAEDLAARYRDADVVVFPPVWVEPFGLVPLEAMACGTPVVATGTGGSAEYLRHGENCLLFPPGDHVALADAVTRLAGDADLRERLVAGGRLTARELDIAKVSEVLERWHVGVTAS
jgi:glycogen(starch) synthase